MQQPDALLTRSEILDAQMKTEMSRVEQRIHLETQGGGMAMEIQLAAQVTATETPVVLTATEIPPVARRTHMETARGATVTEIRRAVPVIAMETHGAGRA